MHFLMFQNTLKKSKNMENYKQERAFKVSDQISVGPSFFAHFELPWFFIGNHPFYSNKKYLVKRTKSSSI